MNYALSMNEKVTDFGILCRKLRTGKRWSMTEVANMLGYSQNSITQIEQGKTNPSSKFIEECLKVYEISGIERANFIALALSCSNKLTLNMDKVTIIPKEDLAKIMAVLSYNLEEPYPDTPDWKAATKALKRLFDGIQERSLSYNVLRIDD